MVQDSAGHVIANVTSLQQGQTISLQFADGSAHADVHTIENKEEHT